MNYEAAYETLEQAREDEEHLTPDERMVLNEAHGVLQEHQKRVDKDNGGA